MFGIALWQTRPRRDPELDALLAELALEPGGERATADVIWAAATPKIVSWALTNSATALAPLGLGTRGASAAITGERHGRAVRVELRGQGSTTTLAAPAPGLALAGGEALAAAGRGDAETWNGVRVNGDDERLRVVRDGNVGAAWLWDLWLAERLAER